MKTVGRTVAFGLLLVIALLVFCAQTALGQSAPVDSLKFEQNVLMWNRTDIWSQNGTILDEFHPLVGDQRSVAYVIRNGTRFSAVLVLLTPEVCFFGTAVFQNNQIDVQYHPTDCKPIIELRQSMLESRKKPRGTLPNSNIIQ